MLVHVCVSVVTVVNTQFSWSVCFCVYIYYVRVGGPCLPLWYCAIMGGWRQDWRRLAGIDHAFRLFSMGWGSHLKQIKWLTIIWRFNVLTQQHVFADGTGMTGGGAYIPPLYIHDSVLVLFSYAMPTAERNRTELGTKQERYSAPWFHPNKINHLAMGVDIQSGFVHLSIVAGNDALPSADNSPVDSPGASR